MEPEQQWFDAKRVYASTGGIQTKFHSEAEAHAFLVDGKRHGSTRSWRVGATVTKPFPKTQPPSIAAGTEVQSDF